MRHSSSQALIPCQPLMIGQRFNAQRACKHAAMSNEQVSGSDAAGEINNSSIHFTMEENSMELGAGGSSSLNASRGGEIIRDGSHHPSFMLSTSATKDANTHLLQHNNHTPQANSSAIGNKGSAEKHSMTESKFSLSHRGRFRPNFAAFSSNWSSSGSEGQGGRGNFGRA